jgi:hypothetical protein
VASALPRCVHVRRRQARAAAPFQRNLGPAFSITFSVHLATTVLEAAGGGLGLGGCPAEAEFPAALPPWGVRGPALFRRAWPPRSPERVCARIHVRASQPQLANRSGRRTGRRMRRGCYGSLVSSHRQHTSRHQRCRSLADGRSAGLPHCAQAPHSDAEENLPIAASPSFP